MKSSRSKLLHEIAGHSLVSYSIRTATSLEPERVVVVVGHGRDQVQAHLAEIAPHVITAIQEQQLGTGHAVQVALGQLPDVTGEVVVTYGDVPLLTTETLAELVSVHRSSGSAVTVLTANVADPTGYGRIVRDSEDVVSRVVEDKDAGPEERQISEINSGIYVFDADTLRSGLSEIRAENAQGELYLTDVVAAARRAGKLVRAHMIDDLWQTEGVNDRVQLAAMNAELNRRILLDWMRAGVTVIDPATTWVHSSVDLAPDVTLLPGTLLEGATSVGAGATIGPDTTLIDVEVGERAMVTRTHGSLSVIGPDASVGPFAYLRPGTVLGPRSKIGTFVEAKNSRLGAGAKAPHLSYLGDAEIGDGANIGAGVIFANYDGVTKSMTTVGNYSFVGSDTVLVAPVRVADGTYVAAGSVITGDVEPGELAVSRSPQRNVAGWVARKRAGTKTAAAAEAAQADVKPAEGPQSEPVAGRPSPPVSPLTPEESAQ
jgi:bifunctional UDP-N-acetylglucosamine pyrophosphorylase/glucosamine-1-phosphate N-acetyltransferase